MLDAAAAARASWPGEPPSSLLELVRLGPDAWRRMQRAIEDAPASAGHPLEGLRWHAPVPRPPRNVVCLGRNYAAHVKEAAHARGVDPRIPAFPVFFTKATTCVTGPYDDIPLHGAITTQVDWETELAAVIGVGGVDIPRARALECVFGYTVVNDVSARDLQQQHLQWFKGKSLDGFCPMGPVVVTSDEFGDPQAKRLACRVNGVTKQDASTADMIFPVDAIIEWLSRGTTIEPGDIIATGTPEGVGLGRTPPEFLQDGDVVEAEVEGIGALRNRVRDLS
jgi:2-keto-4-pentenoate hydratase/2-oxohepta-3-ene-1,7-dioic acid hydratase in catechol pathway